MTPTLHVAQLNTNTGWGGGEYQVFHLVAGLTRRGVATTLFAQPDGQLFARAREAGLPTVALPVSDLAPFLPRGVRAVRRALAGRGATLLHVHDSLAAAVGTAAARGCGVPVVFSRRVASPVRRNPFSRRKYSPRVLRAVIAISETVRDVFLRTGYPPDRVFVVPSGLDIEALDRVRGDAALRRSYGSGFLVGGLGRLSVKKNWPLLVRVAAQLAADGPDVQWLLVGDGPERRRLERLVRSLRVADRVHFLGFRRDAAQIMKNFDVLFFPSIMEGASVTVREAMALGVPVVAVDAPGTVESLGGHGWTVRGDDPESAARCLREVLADGERRRRVAAEARESAVARFAMDRTVDGTLRVYETVLSRLNG